jgi:hypothetical protein
MVFVLLLEKVKEKWGSLFFRKLGASRKYGTRAIKYERSFYAKYCYASATHALCF